MKKEITEEMIEEVVVNAFRKANENIALEIAENVETCKNTFTEIKGMQGYEMFVGTMMTAQYTCLKMFKEALKELLCDVKQDNKEETAIQSEQQLNEKQLLVNEIIKLIASKELSVKEARDVLRATSSKLGNEKVTSTCI